MRQVEVDLEAPVHYADYGGDAEPLVIVHGIGGSQLNSSRLAVELSDRFHVYAIDLIGFGQTPNAGRTASMADNQLLIADFIANVTGAPATVIGHSMGGALAMLLAAGDPPAVSRLVLLSPGVGDIHSPAALASTPVLNLMARFPRLFAPLLAAAIRRDTKGAVHATMGKYVRNLDVLDPFLLQAHVDYERERAQHRGAYIGYLEAWRSLKEETADIAQFLKVVVSHIQAPTLLIQGTEDRIVPGEFARQAHAARPDWVVVELPAVGHAPHMERPERIAEFILEWVSRVVPAATPR